ASARARSAGGPAGGGELRPGGGGEPAGGFGAEGGRERGRPAGRGPRPRHRARDPRDHHHGRHHGDPGRECDVAHRPPRPARPARIRAPPPYRSLGSESLGFVLNVGGYSTSAPPEPPYRSLGSESLARC